MPSAGIVRIEPYRLGIVRYGKVVLLLDVVREAAAVECAAIPGIEPYRFTVVGDRMVVVALGGIRIAASGKDRGIVGSERNRCGEIALVVGKHPCAI